MYAASGGDGFLERLDPRSKIVFVVLVSAAAFHVTRLDSAVLLLTFIALLWALGRLPGSLARGYARLIGAIGLFLFVSQCVFRGGGTPVVSPLVPSWVPLIGGAGSITAEGVRWGIISVSRLAMVVLALPLLTFTTQAGTLALGLVRFGIPYESAFLVTTALNLVPSIRREAETIIQARLLRGSDVLHGGSLASRLRWYASIAAPLGISCMRRAHLMGVAMDSRAFGVKKDRTFLSEISMKPADWVFVAVSMAVCLFAALRCVVGVAG